MRKVYYLGYLLQKKAKHINNCVQTKQISPELQKAILVEAFFVLFLIPFISFKYRNHLQSGMTYQKKKNEYKLL